MSHTWILLTCCLHLAVQMGLVLPQGQTSRPVTIGVIFEANGDQLDSVFRFAMDYVNDRQMLGPDLHLAYILNTTSGISDAFDVFQIVCEQAASGVVAYIGPLTSSMVIAVAPLAAGMHLPMVVPFATSPLLARTGRFPYVVRMSPPDSLQGRALVDLVAHFGWKRMAVLTSDTDYGVHGLVSFSAEAARRGWHVVSVQRFRVTSRVSDIDATQQLALIKDLGVRVVILHCLSAFGLRVLDQAASFNMTSSGWAWVISDGLTTTAVDAAGAERLIGAVGTRPAVDRGRLAEHVNAYWRMSERTTSGLDALRSRILDAVFTLTFAIRDLPIPWRSNVTAPRLDCLSGRGWEHGQDLLESVLQVDEDGVSARLQFTSDQSPAVALYDYVNMQRSGWVKVGEWSEEDGLSLSGPVELAGGRRNVTDTPSRLRGRHLRVVLIDEPPFVFLPRRRPKGALNRSQVKGYCLDLLDRIAQMTGFTYSLYSVPDGIYGAKNPITGQWNGLVKELVDRKADIAAGPFTITNVRVREIDFTKPFFDQGIGIVMQKPPPEPWDPFKFTRPFSAELWYYILGTTLGVGIYLSLLNKLSPYDTHGQFVYRDEPRQSPRSLRNPREFRIFKRNKMAATTMLSLGNSLWLSVASLLHQGAEQYPRALSSRLSLLLWWMGIVILIATYTANLAAHLTSNRGEENIASVEDLAAQTHILYGTVAHSAVHQFLADSEVPLYSEMVSFMRQRHTIVNNSTDGFNMARRGGYAFLWDSAVLEYAVQQAPCQSLQALSRTFGKSGYGFGLQKNSPYNQELSQHILSLREAGFMEELREKWYTLRGECSSSSNTKENLSRRSSHMVGVFIIMWAGCGAGILILILEWIVACASGVDKRHPKKPHSFAEAFRRRFKAVRLDLWDSFFRRCSKRPPYTNEGEDSHHHNQVPNGRGMANGHGSQTANTNFILSSGPKTRKLQLPRGSLLGRSLSHLDELNGRHQAYLRAAQARGRHSERSNGSHSRSHTGSQMDSSGKCLGLDNWAFFPESSLRYSSSARASSPITVSYGPFHV